VDKLAIIFALAVIVEAVVNIFFKEGVASKWKQWVALACGVAMTVVWGVGVIAAVDLPIPNEVARYFDYVLTGILVSRGSNYLHTLVLAVKSAYTKPAV
jgi:hypothetical protein